MARGDRHSGNRGTGSGGHTGEQHDSGSSGQQSGGGGRRRGHWGGSKGARSDIDHRYGNEWSSWGYARRYDQRSETEYTHLPETTQQLQAAESARARPMRWKIPPTGAQDAIAPDLGNFIVAQENSWAAQAALVKDERNELGFNPGRYRHWDNIIAQQSGIRGLHDTTHRDYPKYDSLRTNLAALRNTLLSMYSQNGNSEESVAFVLENMAESLGMAMANDRFLVRWFMRSIDTDMANIEGVGAAELYRFLYERQNPAGLFQNVRANLDGVLNMPDRVWNLPPMEATPFSYQGLMMPPPVTDGPPAPPETAMDAHERMIALSENLGDTARKLRSPEMLDAPVREESVDEARKILRWLRNLQFTDRDMEEWLDQGTPAEQVAKAEALQQLVALYAQQLKTLQQQRPELLNDASIEDASNAAGAMALAIAEHTLVQLPENHPQRSKLEALIATLPPQSELHVTQSVTRLLDTLELGMERASGRQVGELSPVQRLIAMSSRIEKAARSMRSVESMAPPAREESVELAREILRKLRNLSFSNRPIEELVDTGRPEDKAAFAQKLDEMVDSYHSLLAEAAQSNPNILQDERVREANSAVGSFAYAIKLMAAKEIPSSAAAAQQISADVTRMPEDWKDLHDRTVDRLTQKAEKGLERVAEELAAQQQEQQHDDDLAQQEGANNALHTESAKRRRRRKRRSRSGAGGKKQTKQHLDLTADDYVLKQGRFAKDAKAASSEGREAALKGLSPDDMKVIKDAGSSLRDISEQLRALNATMASVTHNDKIAPDDKTIAQRTIEEQQKNPRGPSGPGV